ncbi:ABC transporter substrate-binding protein [uncultured Thiohalocapsa sp.]|uniref:ABC transporter substrate-binding protein n=1 Tax=uncultured Thiohalocapsa sp. TaxID=768990 RepID=UPI0025D85F25|nr:ABC transporter substrate-binding protein [uncultured Thiohalocapsa sp.]
MYQVPLRALALDRRWPVTGPPPRTLLIWPLALLLTALVGGVASRAATAAEALPRVMGTNLCADLLLDSTAAPAQIVSLSRQSRDATVSPIAARAAAYPANDGGVEDLLYHRPDKALVYLGWTGGRFATLLAGQGIELIEVPYPAGWDDALASARAIAAEIGRAETGAALAAAAEQRMRELAEALPPLRVLYLRPGGGSAGAGTYVDDVITRLGLVNLAAEQGHVGWGAYPLERIITDPPDVFLLSYFEQAPPPGASAYARHPLLRDLLARTPTVQVPSQSWGCGGLELVGAAEAIAAQLRALSWDGGP